MNQAFHIQISGAIQGVGFRPFVYRLAHELNLRGYVLNSAQGLFIKIEGRANLLEVFLKRLEKEKPPIAVIHSLEHSIHKPENFSGFEIRKSENNGKKTVRLLPDIATCPDCIKELFNPNDRRYRYPFINCTNCGPRFSIIEALPYDRPNTSMKGFGMCPQCQQEYENPAHRRLHAQPNACPVCGPHLELQDSNGKLISSKDLALLQAADVIREGKILAFKGIGGLQLLVDARNNIAVEVLRKRKNRQEKPFAIMYPNVEMAKVDCHISALEEKLLLSPAAPIVLLEKKECIQHRLVPGIAPANPQIGVMLPYTPLHHLLMAALGFPIVATSGNVSDEPICIDEKEALKRLGGIADAFLVHNRPIIRHVDDSVVRVLMGQEQILRRARGYAPLPLHLKDEMPQMMAFGAHLKNTVTISTGSEIYTSQHIGDLETAEAFSAFQKVIKDFQQLYEVKPVSVVCDLHPEYLSSKYAQKVGLPVIKIQHHYAHVLACMMDNEINGPVLGISWDGTGYGTDGTIWGGEFLLTHEDTFERVAHFRNFRLPGGEAAIKEPARTAIGILFEIFGEKIFSKKSLCPVKKFSQKELSLFQQMLVKGINSPITSSAGRLFDAVAAIINLRDQVSFEGQAAMELEFSIQKNVGATYSFIIHKGKPTVIDWEPMIKEIIKDTEKKLACGIIAAKFHNTLTEIVVSVAELAGQEKVVLTGGCFQNKYLTVRTVEHLKKRGFVPYWHHRIPPNDGGIAPGQLMAAIMKGNKQINRFAMAEVN